MQWQGSADPEKRDSAIHHSREFEWRCGRDSFSLDIDVPAYLYRYYENRWRTREFGTYVIDPFHEDLVEAITADIEAQASNRGYDRRDLVRTVLRFGQSITYERDIVTTDRPEYPQFPVETLFYERGDCEDLSILLASLLWEMGIDSVLVVLPRKAHMGLGVAVDWGDGLYFDVDGTKYYFVESTYPGWDLGEAPPEYESATIETYPVDDVPLMLHHWEATDTGDGNAEIEGSVVNFGTGDAREVSVRAWFEGSNDQSTWPVEVMSEDVIYPSSSESFSATVQLPRAGRIRGHVRVYIGKTLHDETVSDWG